MRGFLVWLLWAQIAGAEQVTYEFQWVGGGGYGLSGAMSYDSAAISGPIVTEDDVTCFVIEGRHNGQPIGRWALGHLTSDTTWQLTFLPAQSAFVGYNPITPMPQAWNMDGAGRNCGAGGFGFNIGNAAQDICVDGRLILESQAPPRGAIPARRNDLYDFAKDACRPPLLLGSKAGALDVTQVAAVGAASQ